MPPVDRSQSRIRAFLDLLNSLREKPVSIATPGEVLEQIKDWHTIPAEALKEIGYRDGGPVGVLRMQTGGAYPKGFLRFANNIADWFGGASRKAIQEVNEEARKTGMEAGRFGHGSAQTGQEWVSVPGLATTGNVDLTKTPTPSANANLAITYWPRIYRVEASDPQGTGYQTFRRDMDARHLPEGFQVHSHPPINQLGGSYGDPDLIRAAIQGGEVGPLAPSLGDIHNWLQPWGLGAHRPYSDTRFASYITGSQPNALVALGAPDYGKGYGTYPGGSKVSPSAMLINASDINDQRGELFKAIKASPAVREIMEDYKSDNPANIWAALHALRFGRADIPITYDAKTPLGIGYLEDAMSDLFKRLASRGEDISGLAGGGPVEMQTGGGPVQHFGKGSLVQDIAEGALRRFTGRQRTREAERLAAEEAAANAARSKSDAPFLLPPEPRLQTVNDPVRLSYPGIYKDPRDIVQDALQPDHLIPDPGKQGAMFRLFGHDRQSLDALSQGRPLEQQRPWPLEQAYRVAPGGSGSSISEQVLNPRNMKRLLDVAGESLKYPELAQTRSWYEMLPFWDRANYLGVSPEEQRLLNMRMALHSAGASPVSEVNRGTLAHALAQQGRLDDFIAFGGTKASDRGGHNFPADMLDMSSHAYHKTAHVPGLVDIEATGRSWSPKHKVPTYTAATDPVFSNYTRPVADSHFARGLGYPDVRTARSQDALFKELTNPEYDDLLPWWDRLTEKSGLRPIGNQALLWNVMGPQTGVRYIGPPKLEMISNEIMKASRRLGVTPEEARDMVITGKAAAYADGGQVGNVGNVGDPGTLGSDVVPYFAGSTPAIGTPVSGEGGGTLSWSNNVDAFGNEPRGFADGGSTGYMFLDSSDNLSRAMNERITMTPEKRYLKRVQDNPPAWMRNQVETYINNPVEWSEAQSPDYGIERSRSMLRGGTDAAMAAARMLATPLGLHNMIPEHTPFQNKYVSTERERALGETLFDPTNFVPMGALGRGLATGTKYIARRLPNAAGRLGILNFQHGLSPADEGPSNSIYGYSDLADPVTGEPINAAEQAAKSFPGIRRMHYADGGPVNMNYPNGGQVPGYRFGGELDQWYGEPGMSMYADGGPVHMEKGGGLKTLGGMFGGGDPGAPTDFMGFGGGSGAAEGIMGATDFFAAKGGRVDDDALLYHAIDTQNFRKGGALRYCGEGYAR